MVQVRRWYRNRLDAIDVSTDEGRWLRLAFLAMEGAFLMRLFGLVEMDSDEWRSIVADVWALCDGKLPQAQDAPDGIRHIWGAVSLVPRFGASSNRRNTSAAGRVAAPFARAVACSRAIAFASATIAAACALSSSACASA